MSQKKCHNVVTKKILEKKWHKNVTKKRCVKTPLGKVNKETRL